LQQRPAAVGVFQELGGHRHRCVLCGRTRAPSAVEAQGGLPLRCAGGPSGVAAAVRPVRGRPGRLRSYAPVRNPHTRRGHQDNSHPHSAACRDRHGHRVDTTQGTVHMIIGGGGTSAPSYQLCSSPDPPAGSSLPLGRFTPPPGTAAGLRLRGSEPWFAVFDGAKGRRCSRAAMAGTSTSFPWTTTCCTANPARSLALLWR